MRNGCYYYVTMETLRNEYASDSSEEENAAHVYSEAYSAKIVEKSSEKSIDNVGLNMDTAAQQAPDFFGLLSPESDTTSQVQTDDSDDEVSKTVNVDGKETVISIPKSNFWTSVAETDLQTLQRTNRTLSSPGYSRNRVEKQMYSELKSNKRNIDNRQTNTSGAKLLKQDQDTTLALNTVHSGNRKMFFVHSKITQYLHTKRYSSKLPHKQEWTASGHAGAVNRVKWNIPSYSHLLVSCSMDSSIKIWNIWSQLDPCVKVLSSHTKAVRDVSWSQSGSQLLSCSYDKSAAVTEVESGKCLHRLEHRSYVTCCLFHPSKPHLCITGENNNIQIWDCRTPKLPCKTLCYKDTIGQVQDLILSKDGSTLFSCSDLVSRDSSDRNLMAWHMDTGVVLSNQIYQERYTVTRLKTHPHDHTILAQCQGNYVAIFSQDRPYKMNKHKRFEGHKLLGYNVGFDVSSDGRFIYSGSSDGKLYCYDYQSGKRQAVLTTGQDVVLDVDCHPVLPSTVALSAWDGTLMVWS